MIYFTSLWIALACALRLSDSPAVLAKMARVYADVNSQMPRAYWDYDSVNINWGILENYEVVRKIGESARIMLMLTSGAMSTESLLTNIDRSRQVLGSVRRIKRHKLSEMRHQGLETSQEEEDKA